MCACMCTCVRVHACTHDAAAAHCEVGANCCLLPWIVAAQASTGSMLHSTRCCLSSSFVYSKQCVTSMHDMRV